jgi:hypothetical protein
MSGASLWLAARDGSPDSMKPATISAAATANELSLADFMISS